MLSCSIWFSARHHPHRTHDLRSGSYDHHPSKTSVQKTICCNSTSDPPDDGRMYPKHIELRIHQYNYLVASSWHFTLIHLAHTSILLQAQIKYFFYYSKKMCRRLKTVTPKIIRAIRGVIFFILAFIFRTLNI